MCSIERGHYRIMKTLLNSNPDLTLVDNNNYRAIDYYYNNFDIINRELINRGYTNEQIMNQYNPFNN
jgi:hypothetical protein